MGGVLAQRGPAYIEALKGQSPPPLALAPPSAETKHALGEHATASLNILHASINRLRALAQKAEEEDQLGLSILAHKEVAKLTTAYVQMQVGKTMNLNANIRHQGDIQDWKTVPAEVRKAVLEDVAREMMEVADE